MLLLLGGCRSLDGLTGGAPITDAGIDADTDASTPSCSPSATTGTICVKVRLDDSALAPGYGAFSGAPAVKADGNGFVQVYLFDKDPADPENGHVLPKLTLRHPPAAGSEMKLEELTVELVASAPAQKYWVFALFEDNAADARGTGLLSPLPGDFVTVENLEDPSSLFPVVTLVTGQTSALDLPVAPLRELTLNSSASTGLLDLAKNNPNVHGSGPASFFLYDGSLAAGKPEIVDFSKIGCVDLQLQNPQRPALIPVTMSVTATGTHNLYGNIYDYQSPQITGSLPPGSVGTNGVSPPEVSIDATSWTAAVDVVFEDVNQPLTGSVTDLLECK